MSVEKKSIVRHSNKEYIGHPLIIFDKGFEKKNCFCFFMCYFKNVSFLNLCLRQILPTYMYLNPAYGKVYSIQLDIIKFVSDMQQVGQWFSQGTLVSSANKTNCHDISEILLKVTLTFITLTLHDYPRSHNLINSNLHVDSCYTIMLIFFFFKNMVLGRGIS